MTFRNPELWLADKVIWLWRSFTIMSWQQVLNMLPELVCIKLTFEQLSLTLTQTYNSETTGSLSTTKTASNMGRHPQGKLMGRDRSAQKQALIHSTAQPQQVLRLHRNTARGTARKCRTWCIQLKVPHGMPMQHFQVCLHISRALLLHACCFPTAATTEVHEEYSPWDRNGSSDATPRPAPAFPRKPRQDGPGRHHGVLLAAPTVPPGRGWAAPHTLQDAARTGPCLGSVDSLQQSRVYTIQFRLFS